MIFDKWEELCRTHEIIAVFTAKEQTEVFTAGRVLAYNETQILLNMYDPYGNFDGFCVKLLENVFLIERLTPYLNMLERLLNIKGSNVLDSAEKFSCMGDSLVAQLLKYARNKQFIVSVQMYESGCNDAVGMVDTFAQNTVTILLIDEYGTPNGKATFPLEVISQIICHSQQEQNLKLLMENR